LPAFQALDLARAELLGPPRRGRATAPRDGVTAGSQSSEPHGKAPELGWWKGPTRDSPEGVPADAARRGECGGAGTGSSRSVRRPAPLCEDGKERLPSRVLKDRRLRP